VSEKPKYPVVYCAGGAVIGHASSEASAKAVCERRLGYCRMKNREHWTARLVGDWNVDGPLRDGSFIAGFAWACGLQLSTSGIAGWK
jgi:hypothetical protein